MRHRRALGRKGRNRVILPVVCLLACGGEEAVGPVQTPTVAQGAATIRMSRSTVNIASLGDTAYLRAQALDSRDSVIAGATILWSSSDRNVVEKANEALLDAEEEHKGNEGIFCGAAIELADGTLIKGNNSPLMHAASSLVINAIKHLADIPDKIHLLPNNITESIGKFKNEILNSGNVSLDLEETLIALCVGAMSNSAAQLAIEKLPELKGCEMHLTHIPTRGDEEGLRSLGVNVTSDANFPSKNLYMK